MTDSYQISSVTTPTTINHDNDDPAADINDHKILGFKYSTTQESITISPPKGSRKVAFLEKINNSFHEAFLVEKINNSFHEWRWRWIDEPEHDSNKLYASFKGLPTGRTDNIDLEDLGLYLNTFNTSSTSCSDQERDYTSATSYDQERDANVRLTDFIGSGWMSLKDDIADALMTPLLMAFISRQGNGQRWSVLKVKLDECDLSISKAIKSDDICDLSQAILTMAKSQECDIFIPLVHPKRILSKDGVYFVG